MCMLMARRTWTGLLRAVKTDCAADDKENSQDIVNVGGYKHDRELKMLVST